MNLLLVWGSAALTRALREKDWIAGWLQKSMGAMFMFIGVRSASERA